MERQSDKHGPRVDEQLDDEYERTTPSIEAEQVSRHPDTPPGTLSDDEVAARTELAASLQPSVFPAGKEELLASAQEMGATPSVIEALGRLPDGQTFENVQQVWTALGGTSEQRS